MHWDLALRHAGNVYDMYVHVSDHYNTIICLQGKGYCPKSSLVHDLMLLLLH